jgi:2-keto-4-pentenoate hydratase
MSVTGREQEASDILFTLWQQGKRIVALPEPLRPRNRAEGYRIQAMMETRSAVPLYGWKIAATSRAGQAHINVDGPLAGRLLAERVFRDGAELRFGANHMGVIEGEFAFRMASDLPPRAEPYSVTEVMTAVGSLYPAIEIPDSRYEDFTAVGTAQIVADNACAHEFVLGPVAPESWREMDLAAHAVMGRVVGKLEREGSGANVLGDPRRAVTWLANELSGIGVTLKAGQVVTTGTCVAPMEVAAGDRVEMEFGTLGRVSMSFGKD